MQIMIEYSNLTDSVILTHLLRNNGSMLVPVKSKGYNYDNRFQEAYDSG